MRKAISLFLAAAVLCLSTSALADVGTTNVANSKNGQTTLNSTYAGSGGRTATMPGFRPGDTISFDVTGVTNGNEMTLICYKYGAESGGLDNSEVIYINQYTLTKISKDISYKIPASAESGIYKVVINDSSNPVANFYFKVGTATVSVLNGNGRGNVDGNRTNFVTGTEKGGPYILKKIGDTYSVGFVGKVTVPSGDIRLQDIGANPGFAITDGTTTKQYGFGINVDGVTLKSVAGLDSTVAEVNGSYSIIYGVTMYNVPDGSQNLIKAQAVLDAAN